MDTGFDGHLAVPGELARLLDAAPLGRRARQLADGSRSQFAVHELLLPADDAQDEASRVVEVLVMEGESLLGTQFLSEHL